MCRMKEKQYIKCGNPDLAAQERKLRKSYQRILEGYQNGE